MCSESLTLLCCVACVNDIGDVAQRSLDAWQRGWRERGGGEEEERREGGGRGEEEERERRDVAPTTANRSVSVSVYSLSRADTSAAAASPLSPPSSASSFGSISPTASTSSSDGRDTERLSRFSRPLTC